MKLINSIRTQLQKLFVSEEPHWHWGLFCVLFSLITCENIFKKSLSQIHTNPYYSLPLFEFFKIPPPSEAVSLLNGFLDLSLSLYDFFYSIKMILAVCLLLSAAGLFFQRFWIICSLIFFFLFQGWLYGYIRTADSPYVWHSSNIIFFVLLIWSAAPSNPRWTAGFWIKRMVLPASRTASSPLCLPVTPRLLVILTIALTYFGSFYCKFHTSGLKWIDGYTLQAYLLEASQEAPLSHALWLADKIFYFLWFLNIMVWVFQSTAPVGFLFPRTRLLYGAAGVVFHVGLFLFLGVIFNPFSLYYVVFIPELYLLGRALYKRTALPLMT